MQQQEQPTPRRTLVIGDIHGCMTAFNKLLDFIKLQPDDLLITLGDYIDRGPDSKGVIDRLLQLQKSHNLVSLRGNHELMMLKWWQTTEAGQDWWNNGGNKTVASYTSDFDTLIEMEVFCQMGKAALFTPEQMAKLKDIFPIEHIHFIEFGCCYWYETKNYIFVHGMVDPSLEMPQQDPTNLVWQRFSRGHDAGIRIGPHCSGKKIVCGHTPQFLGLPVDIGHAVCIDTGPFMNDGWLTCLDIDRNDFYQANEQGQVRRLDPDAKPPAPPAAAEGKVNNNDEQKP